MKKFKDIRSFFQTNTPKTREANTEVDATRRSIPTPETSINSIQESGLNEEKEVPSTKDSEHSLVCSTASTSQSADSAVEADVVVIDSMRTFSKNVDKPNKSGTLQVGPSQPVIDFPKTKFGTKFRSFSSKYYESYNSWLEYSKEEDKVYCFVYRHFNKGNIRDQNERFVKSGFNDWKKLAEALKNTQNHRIALNAAKCMCPTVNL
ncbi:zinc finger MYM-type protein 5 [Cephus cinctus]|uniref:Zinc finger MYM-type protein 5 n=1 Tax=Cephus cinctus TaxID=211228 RepID=A0AAJ7CEJ9_CEPCN|nr:zinc finger MYM-type protein 5 [Cephus cinctus]